MANWKKVIVSGSDAELHHITASGNISASGFLFGNLPSGTVDEVVIYNTATGRLEFKVLNLINTEAAPGLFLADIHPDLYTDDNYEIGDTGDNTNVTGFNLSYDTGSSAVGGDVYSYTLLSASYNANGATYTKTISLADSRTWVGINGRWLSAEDTDEVYFQPGDPGTDITSSILDERQALYKGEASSSVTINLQAIDATTTAVPAYAPVTYNNYNAKAFKDGGVGELRIYVNNNDINSPVRTINLASDYTHITSTVNDITVDIPATASNRDSNTGDFDTTKHYRSGSSYTIGVGSASQISHQRDGYNFSFVLHTGSIDGNDFAHITNFVEWFYDIEGAKQDLSIVNQGVIDSPIFTANDTSSISGIKFFDSTAANNTRIKYGVKVDNQYRNIYPYEHGIQFDSVTTNTINDIQVTQSGQYQVLTQVEDTSLGTNNNRFDLAPLQNVANAYTTDTTMTASLDIDFVGLTNNFYQPPAFLDGFTSDNIESTANQISFTTKFDHINGHKTVSQVDANTVTYDSYMVNNLSSNANEYQFEDFKGETYRIVSRSYAVSDTSSVNTTYNWDSSLSIIDGGGGHSSGSIVYYSHLLYPTGAGDGGDFTTTLGPGNQYDYTTSGGGVGEREYYRYFKLDASANSAATVNIEIVGSGKVVKDGNSNHFGTGDNDAVKIYAWRDSDPSSQNYGTFLNVTTDGFRAGTTITNTSWIPMATTAGAIDYSETANTSINGESGIDVPNGVVKFSDISFDPYSEGDFIIIKIVVPEDWTGYIDAIALKFGASTPGGGSLLGNTYTNL